MLGSAKSRNFILKAIVAITFIYFFWLMLNITLDYVPIASDVSFLMIKQTEVTSRPEYLPIFYIHVYSSIFALLAGFIAVFFDKNLKYLHRFSGRIYVFVTLIFSSLSGIYIGFFANGGWTAKLSFVLLGILWFYTTYKSYSEIRRKNIVQHKFWMWRSYALAVSAITLRMWKVILVYLFQPNPMDVYQVIAWLGWIPNLLLVEYLIKKQNR
ncbi:DUF2306 domain-containing protein [Epilithonimonas arachidiradicis]|uniref:Putative membrane protein DUF2306 n=1 Tax=Epilithonimonas arachidiradicis TaxID=1617282 RepID=A0A420DE35_9FLAO|nr:DUF2306 domain-containing protein [Epilithonimonas arachidiradicis]RKE89809.1 putative membrane protein DUF2306 [Epilithonimonas arachidiradicis]